jgi:hypothetical protein
MPDPRQRLLLLDSREGFFRIKEGQILSDHPKGYPAAQDGNIGRVCRRQGPLSSFETTEKAFFSTRSTALHQPSALTLRGGSA